MKIKSIFIGMFMIIATFLFQSCNTNEAINSTSNTSKIRLKLVDSEGNYDKVLVNIIDVQYNRNDDDMGWTTFEGFTLPETDDHLDRIDLTELIAGNSIILTDQDIESGMLSKIRLILGEGNAIVLEGETEEISLKTPSAMQSGLKLHMDTELVAGFSYTFVLDWDVQKSIVKAGNSGIYNLKPVIRVVAEVNSGTIKGRVADIDETKDGTDPMPIEGATLNVYDKDDTSIGTTETNVDGLYMFQGLPAGDYKLKVEKGDYNTLTTDPILVEVGVETTKDIHLTKSTGNISGRIADSSETDVVKIPLGNAKVDVYTKDDTNFDTIIATATTSNENDDTKGSFDIMDLLPGEYILKVSLDTYGTGQSEVIEVIIDQTVDVGTILLTLI
jgi:hypothetical protein